MHVQCKLLQTIEINVISFLKLRGTISSISILDKPHHLIATSI